MKISKVFRKAARKVGKLQPYSLYEGRALFGCCRTIANTTPDRGRYYRDSFNAVYADVWQSRYPHSYYFGDRKKDNVLTRELALLFAAEYYADLGD